MQSFEALLARAYADLKAGKPVLLADDHDRENEVDAIASAATITTQTTAWIIRYTSGYLCAPMTQKRADYLKLPYMVSEAHSQDPKLTAYTVTCDASHGITTGISAGDRTTTFHTLASPTSTPADLQRPGHVVPLRAKEGGVLTRDGHTEGTVDLCRLAGLPEVGVLAEMVNDDGTMMRYDQARIVAEEKDLVLLTIADLKAWRKEHDLPENLDLSALAHPNTPTDKKSASAIDIPRIARIATAELPTKYGDFTVHCYRDLVTSIDHVALVADGKETGLTPLVRIHSECLTGEAFGSLRCDCGPQLHEAMKQVSAQGGAIIYLRGQEGRGIGLSEKLKAYALQDAGRDTAEANIELGWPVDRREYGAAVAILEDLGLTRIRLLTNNPEKLSVDSVIDVEQRVGLEVGINTHNMHYLQTKQQLGHLFTHLPKEA